jgi:hypothetical protein
MNIWSLVSKAAGGLLKRPLLIALIAVVAWGGVQTARLRAERRARVRAEISLVNERASMDTTRESYAQGVRVWSRLAYQVSLSRDSIDAALGIETQARIAAEARIATLEGDTATAVTEEEGVRFTELHVYEEPFTLDVEVMVPPPDMQSTWNYRVELDPLLLNARVACRDSDDVSVREAEVSIDGPDWASIDLKSVEQEPGICNPEALAILEDSFWSRLSIGPLAMVSLRSGYWLGGGMACYDGWCVYGGYGKGGEDFGFSKTFQWSPFK